MGLAINLFRNPAWKMPNQHNNRLLNRRCYGYTDIALFDGVRLGQLQPDLMKPSWSAAPGYTFATFVRVLHWLGVF